MSSTSVQLRKLVVDVTAKLAHLGTVSNSTSVRFDGGDYQRLYLRPNYKLGSALETSRELLVVVSPFREQQTRTLAAAEQWLADAKGRLEPGIVIIFHLDSGGDDRLRVWGNDRSLTVLPVCCLQGVPGGDALRDSLSAGLYAIDAFDLTGPVRSIHQFFGRSHVPDLARRLAGGHIEALFGVRKVGKTSVLNRVVHDARAHHDALCVMVDCSDDALSGMTEGQLLQGIAAAIDEANTPDANGYASVEPGKGSDVSASTAARMLIDAISRVERSVIVAMDEIDYISPTSPTAPGWATQFNPFFRALRQVYQECARRDRKFSLLLCGVSSRWFTVESIDGVENAALALVPETYLPPLDRAEAVDMVQTLGRVSGLSFGAKAAETVAAAGSDLPFWIRKLGSYINSCFPLDQRPITMRATDVEALCEEFLTIEGGQLAYSSISHLFRIYPELGPVALASLSAGDPAAFDPALVSTLGRYGLLGDEFLPSGPMVVAALRRWRDSAGTQLAIPGVEPEPADSRVRADSSSETAADEWANLLGEVSRSRNIVERRLRELALVVVRSEVVNDGRKPTDVILAAVPIDRREQMKKLSATAALKAFYWTDLVNLVKKNWKWFEKLFGDRSRFDLYTDIVNDRPDAHAKELDGPELALQRRALDWISERIEMSGLL